MSFVQGFSMYCTGSECTSNAEAGHSCWYLSDPSRSELSKEVEFIQKEMHKHAEKILLAGRHIASLGHSTLDFLAKIRTVELAQDLLALPP